MHSLNIFKTIAVLVLSTLLSGCLKQVSAPIRNWAQSNRGWYTVTKGDTLYSIARKHRKTVTEIARLNNLNVPYTLKIGQKLKINIGQVSKKPMVTAKPVINPVAKPAVISSPSPAVIKNSIKWVWPAKGEVIGKFVQGQARQNGIIITNKLGTPVQAAADGVVIYSGSALRGYGNLLIIKHELNYLTAYAHNQKILVKEKDTVQRGQQIATMGASGSDRVKLHFEIRYHGKPIDPLKLLP